MKINDIMTRRIETISPDDTICDAARLMAKMDSGALLISENESLIGMITDRDIAIRAVAEQLDHTTLVRDIMTASIHFCFADEEVDQVAENMADLDLQRLPVLDRDRHLVGVVSLGNIVSSYSLQATGTQLQDVTHAH